MTINRKYLNTILSEKLNIKQEDSILLLETILDTLSNSIAIDGELKISNFGTFTTHERKERTGYNPHTQEKTTIQACKTTSFHASNKINTQLKANSQTIDINDDYDMFM